MTATITSGDQADRDAGSRAGAWWFSWPVAGVAALAVLAGGWLVFGGIGGDGAAHDGPTYRVTRGPMTVHVTESGTIQAREQVVLKSEVEGQTTIIWLIEEGKHVQEGDLLVELDASKLEDNRVDQQIRVQNAEASYVRARENLQITHSQGESDVARAELDYEFAVEDLKKYVEGEYPKQHNEMEAKIKLAEGDLEDAQRTAQWSNRLYDEKYISETDKIRDELRRDRAQLDLETAIANRDLLVNFTYQRRVRELESNVDQTRMSLERVKRQALANVVQNEADHKAKQSELNRQKEKLAKIEDQISKTKVHAPASGMVIYATTGQNSHRGNDEPLEAGRAVREREELIHLPTANAMLINIKVHESSLKKVQVGQPVRVTINALPGKAYSGKVARIAPLPDAQNFWRGNPDLKVYNTEIHLDGELEGVRTGMTCKAQVIIQQLEDVLSVPIQSVIKLSGQPTVYVRRSGRAKPVSVALGMDNKDKVHVISGLEDGDMVLTNPPLDKTDDLAQAATGEPGPEAESAKAEPGAAGSDAKPAQQARADTPADTSAKPRGERAERGGERQAGHDQGEGHGGAGRPTPEQIAKRREEMKNMTPEQREEMRKKMQQRRRSREKPDAGEQK